MKLANRSSYRLADLRPLVAFAMARAGTLAELAVVEFLDSGEGETCAGEAQWKVEGQGVAYPSLARVWLSNPEEAIYPLRRQYVEGAPVSVVNSWTEEALLVIAHELRHIVQFWSGQAVDPFVMEVDAETFAIDCLNAWRSASALKKAA